VDKPNPYNQRVNFRQFKTEAKRKQHETTQANFNQQRPTTKFEKTKEIATKNSNDQHRPTNRSPNF